MWAPSLVRDYSAPLERVEETRWKPATVTDYTREQAAAAAEEAEEIAFQPKVFTYPCERPVGS